MNKLYYSIKEVSKLVDEEQHILRYWEKEFPVLHPKKNKGGNRTYSEKDIEIIQKIKKLIRQDKLTLKAAKDQILTKEVEPRIINKQIDDQSLFISDNQINSSDDITNEINQYLAGESDISDISKNKLNNDYDITNNQLESENSSIENELENFINELNENHSTENIIEDTKYNIQNIISKNEEIVIKNDSQNLENNLNNNNITINISKTLSATETLLENASIIKLDRDSLIEIRNLLNEINTQLKLEI